MKVDFFRINSFDYIIMETSIGISLSGLNLKYSVYRFSSSDRFVGMYMKILLVAYFSGT
jgi:hypothetical protein